VSSELAKKAKAGADGSDPDTIQLSNCEAQMVTMMNLLW